jgi:hypothetical protein
LTTFECGLGDLWMGTAWTVNPPAAGKWDSIRVRDVTDLFVVVVAAVVAVVPVEPAMARDGRTTAAENPPTAKRTAAVRTRRLT